MEMPDFDKLIAQEAKRAAAQKKLEEINPFGTGTKIVKQEGEIEMKQISGSTTGAGSGEFHLYRNQRRKELTRLGIMEAEAKQEADNLEFEKRREQAKAIETARTAKKAQKRKRLKEKQHQAKLRKLKEKEMAALNAARERLDQERAEAKKNAKTDAERSNDGAATTAQTKAAKQSETADKR